jgi:regulation of enolase protein 1 (concanavalin A-like superfamily)
LDNYDTLFKVQLRERALAVCLLSVCALIAQLVDPSLAVGQTAQAGWTHIDIGALLTAGSVTYGSTSISIASSGGDVNTTADKFTFVYRPITGNTTVIAKLTSLQAVDPWTQAGVMIRESLTPGARHGFVLTSSGNGTQFRRRTTASGSTAQTAAFGAAGGGVVVASWLKLQRSGSTLTASWSLDGVTWSTISTASIALPSTVYVGLAVASHSVSATTAVLSNVWVVGNGTIDSGMTAGDIGSPAVSGGSWAQAGTYALDGAGTGIAGTSDQFRFVYQPMAGDMDLVTRVAQFEMATANARAGLMVRASTSPSSKQASLLAGPQGVYAVTRAVTSGATTTTGVGASTAPLWLKASRRGTTLTFYTSSTGVTWTQVSQQIASVADEIGLVVTSGDPARLARVRFDNTTMSAIAANQPPTVSLTSPASSVSSLPWIPVTLAATASDSDGSIASVAFYANSTLLATDAAAPYQFTFTPTVLGSYALKAVARDNAGVTAESSIKTLTVLANLPPVVSLTSPLDDSTYTAPAQIAFAATATDIGGAVQRVEFWQGTTLLATDAAVPYTWTWSNVPQGSYAVKAVAYDNGGAMTVSSTRDVLVVGATLPTKVVFTPSSLLSLVLRYVLEIFPAGANPNVSNPVATQDLGLPPILSNESTVDVSSTIFALPPGQYFATVSAFSLLEGELRSPSSPPFTR